MSESIKKQITEVTETHKRRIAGLEAGGIATISYQSNVKFIESKR